MSPNAWLYGVLYTGTKMVSKYGSVWMNSFCSVSEIRNVGFCFTFLHKQLTQEKRRSFLSVFRAYGNCFEFLFKFFNIRGPTNANQPLRNSKGTKGGFEGCFLRRNHFYSNCIRFGKPHSLFCVYYLSLYEGWQHMFVVISASGTSSKCVSGVSLTHCTRMWLMRGFSFMRRICSSQLHPLSRARITTSNSWNRNDTTPW